MQRSSETIGAIGAALAKAQAELADPEKSLVAARNWPARDGSDVSLRGALDRPRHRAQGEKRQSRIKPRKGRNRINAHLTGKAFRKVHRLQRRYYRQ
jgi:hypothetical protein